MELPKPGRIQVEPRRRTKQIRTYPQGNLRDLISRAQTQGELEDIRRFVVSLVDQGKITQKTLRKVVDAGAARQRELSERRIVLPGEGGFRTKGGLIIP